MVGKKCNMGALLIYFKLMLGAIISILIAVICFAPIIITILLCIFITVWLAFLLLITIPLSLWFVHLVLNSKIGDKLDNYLDNID